MKKVLFCLFVCFVWGHFCVVSVASLSNPKANVASASYKLTSYNYARVERSGVLLYKTPSISSADNVYFELPKTYFVLLLSNFSEDFYKVQYRDLVGYVIKNSVLPVEETPVRPYLENVSFRVFSSDGVNGIESPYSSKNPTVVTTVELYESIDYYGVCYGDEFVSGRGDEWYFGLVNGKKCYFYSGLCDNLSAIPQNNEVATASSDPFSKADNDYLYSLVDLSVGMKVTLVVLVTVPAVFLIVMIFKPYKIAGKKSIRQIKKGKKMVVPPQIDEN